PPGEEALAPPDSVSWGIYKNPVSVFICGVAAVILELAEPGVRTGVWEHSTFRTDPVLRMRRTGMAAMVTVYGPRSAAEQMIAGVVRAHDRVAGQTPTGRAYTANDQDLLTWVQATASFGFAGAYSRYVRPLGRDELDRAYRESAPASRLYGVRRAPAGQAQMEALFEAMRDRLEPSPIVFDFLRIVRAAPAFPAAVRPVQPLLVRAAVEMTPPWVRERLGLTAAYGLRPFEASMVRAAGALSDRIVLRDSPAVQSCLRLGLPEDYLYRP
ncbi:MAG: hypothetical protein JWO72_2465, partial [Caulobacteraceae bacterium]|nr:hypothetical protein [Caulobacteraceae bacterium]